MGMKVIELVKITLWGRADATLDPAIKTHRA